MTAVNDMTEDNQSVFNGSLKIMRLKHLNDKVPYFNLILRFYFSNTQDLALGHFHQQTLEAKFCQSIDEAV